MEREKVGGIVQVVAQFGNGLCLIDWVLRKFR